MHRIILHWWRRLEDSELLLTEIEQTSYLDPRTNSGQTPLHWLSATAAISPGLELLIERGASVNAQDEWGQSPLHFAARYSQRPGTIAKLLDHGANPKLQDMLGLTPLGALEAENEAIRNSDDHWRLLDAEWWTGEEHKPCN